MPLESFGAVRSKDNTSSRAVVFECLGVMKESYHTSDTSRLLDMRKSVEVQVDSDFALLLPSGAYEIKKMEPRRRLRSIVFICLMLAVAGIIGFGYFCPDQVKNADTCVIKKTNTKRNKNI